GVGGVRRHVHPACRGGRGRGGGRVVRGVLDGVGGAVPRAAQRSLACAAHAGRGGGRNGGARVRAGRGGCGRFGVRPGRARRLGGAKRERVVHGQPQLPGRAAADGHGGRGVLLLQRRVLLRRRGGRGGGAGRAREPGGHGRNGVGRGSRGC